MEALFDAAIKLICELFVPGAIGKILGEVLVKFKGIILGVLGVIAITGCSSIMSTIQAPPTQLDSYQTLPASLQNYIAPGFDNAITPNKSPFGGEGMANSRVTAGFKDLSYFKVFNRWHMGLDIVPVNNYLQIDEGSRIYGEPLVYATCSGMATSLRDSAGANYIYLECNDKQHVLMFVHNKLNFIPLKNKTNVIAGQPIAVMGNTGNSTGPHVHYSVQEAKTLTFLDPKGFIKMN